MARSHYRMNQLIDDLDELDLPRGVTLSTGERLSLFSLVSVKCSVFWVRRSASKRPQYCGR